MRRLLLAGWLIVSCASQAKAQSPDCCEPRPCPYPRTCWRVGHPAGYHQTQWGGPACYAPTRWTQSPPQPPCPPPCCSVGEPAVEAVAPTPELLPAPRLKEE
ncbi:MAG: hypothetical protein JNM56_32310 [Planctomycetia bacterium]|nr:hypothetical protein [Planctomycetia bacterium]